MTLSLDRFDLIQPERTRQPSVAAPTTPPPTMFPTTIKFIVPISFIVWPKGSSWIKFKSAFTSINEMRPCSGSTTTLWVCTLHHLRIHAYCRPSWHPKQPFQFFSPFGKLPPSLDPLSHAIIHDFQYFWLSPSRQQQQNSFINTICRFENRSYFLVALTQDGSQT